MADNGEIWLNVSEIARQVGKPERTVRRWAQNVAETDRKTLLNGRTVYNLAAFIGMLPLIEPQTQSDNGETLPPMAEAPPVLDAPDEILNAEPEQSELVTQLLADIQFLRAEIERRDVAESELRRLMLADKHELTELRQKVALLVAPPDVAESKLDPAHSTQQNGTEPDQPKPHMTENDREPPRRWWEVWKRKE